VDQITRIFIDTSKSVFQLHGVDAQERVVLRRKIRRSQLLEFFAQLPPTVVGLEACGASHYWARELRALGHEVRLVAPQHVKAYLKRNKNDARDAEAGCEAMSRPTMQFVPVKSAERQAALMLAKRREGLVRDQTRLANRIRGFAAEFGFVAPKGLGAIAPLLARIAHAPHVPGLARELFADLGAELAQAQAAVAKVDDQLKAWHRQDPVSQTLAQVPGVGPIGAALLVLKTPAPNLFPSARHFAAWLGLTPTDHSTAGKVRLGVITRAGDEMLRSVLVTGATAIVANARRGRGKGVSPWLLQLVARKPPKLAAVALANKIARIAWAIMARGELYDPARALRA
jgi:transposase